MAGSGLTPRIKYEGTHGSGTWRGHQIQDVTEFREFLRSTVRARVADDESEFAETLRGLATTGMSTKFVKDLLSTVPDHTGWEIGEALAECILETHCGCEVHFPWNSVRDRRTPRASLPGADLVGFFCEDKSTFLMIGEVKTSSDTACPPSVMHGNSGMTWQLQESAARLDIQHALLRWLHARCRESPYKGLFRRAVSKYIKSGGKQLVLIGFLVRDTRPNEADLKSRVVNLCNRLPGTHILAFAFYLPEPISSWPKLMESDS